MPHLLSTRLPAALLLLTALVAAPDSPGWAVPAAGGATGAGQLAPVTTKERLVEGNTAFALDLVGHLRQVPGNYLVSPYGLSATLVMAAAGAGGSTATALWQGLRLPARGGAIDAFALLSDSLSQETMGGSRLVMGQSVWPDLRFSLRPDYSHHLESAFGAVVTPLDYARDAQLAAGQINAWVKQTTRGRITEAVSSSDLPADTALVLVNTIWFKGDWEVPFDPEDTRPGSFSLSGGGTRTVPLMQRTGGYRLASIPGGRMLEIPYGGERTSMLILLPDRRDGVADLEQRLTPEALAQWIAGLQNQRVQVELPRFKMRWKAEDLGSTLTLMGMGPVFQSSADFSGISAVPGLNLSRVVQEANLSVDESGSEAAAATMIVGLITGLSEEPIAHLRADHPFLLMIRDRQSGSLLFLGRLMDPVE